MKSDKISICFPTKKNRRTPCYFINAAEDNSCSFQRQSRMQRQAFIWNIFLLLFLTMSNVKAHHCITLVDFMISFLRNVFLLSFNIKSGSWFTASHLHYCSFQVGVKIRISKKHLFTVGSILTIFLSFLITIATIQHVKYRCNIMVRCQQSK